MVYKGPRSLFDTLMFKVSKRDLKVDVTQPVPKGPRYPKGT